MKLPWICSPSAFLRAVVLFGAACRGSETPTERQGPDTTPLVPPSGNATAAGFVSRAVASSYRTAPGGRTGTLVSGQAADLLLGGFGFGRSGGGLQFNHPRSIASDGSRLFVSDGHNNRVLVWNAAPNGNLPPDFALGQADLESNAPGAGLHQLNWPGQVSVAPNGRTVLADTYNDRLLVWSSVPVRSGQPADLEIRTNALRWPWGVWTDGSRLVASSTGGRAILIWLSFPQAGNTPPDLVLSDPAIGTPRTVTSNGSFLMVGDHNANGTQAGNWVWRSFPTSARAPDFLLRDPSDGGAPWMQGAFDTAGRMVALGRALTVWETPPSSASFAPSLTVTGYSYRGGDGSGVAFAGGRTYVVAYNDNKVTCYRTLPSTAGARPDFALGSPSLDENTLVTSYFITNPVPATNGRQLFVSSDFDRTLSVWNAIPDESAARPDWIYALPFAPWDNALRGDTLALAGQRQIAIWRKAPTRGELPDLNYKDRIGSVAFQEIRGVAFDDRYFYVADAALERVYVWRGLPAASAEPVFTLSVPKVTRLSSDGIWLAATSTEGQQVRLFRVATLSSSATGSVVGGTGTFNLPQGATLSQGGLTIASTNFNQVHIWRRTDDAAAGRAADAILGASSTSMPPLTTTTGLFWPGVTAFDGSYLWVGEFKFSGRLLRYSVR